MPSFDRFICLLGRSLEHNKEEAAAEAENAEKGKPPGGSRRARRGWGGVKPGSKGQALCATRALGGGDGGGDNAWRPMARGATARAVQEPGPLTVKVANSALVPAGSWSPSPSGAEAALGARRAIEYGSRMRSLAPSSGRCSAASRDQRLEHREGHP